MNKRPHRRKMDWLQLETDLREQLKNAALDVQAGGIDRRSLATVIMTIDHVLAEATGRGYELPESFVDDSCNDG